MSPYRPLPQREILKNILCVSFAVSSHFCRIFHFAHPFRLKSYHRPNQHSQCASSCELRRKVSIIWVWKYQSVLGKQTPKHRLPCAGAAAKRVTATNHVLIPPPTCIPLSGLRFVTLWQRLAVTNKSLCFAAVAIEMWRRSLWWLTCLVWASKAMLSEDAV